LSFKREEEGFPLCQVNNIGHVLLIVEPNKKSSAGGKPSGAFIMPSGDCFIRAPKSTTTIILMYFEKFARYV